MPAEATPTDAVPDAARQVFGEGLEQAIQFVDLLQTHGVERGLIGPREIDRLWDRHVLNSAVLAELIPPSVTVIDVGSGGGFPGIPLAVARPDVTISLLEPMARRVDWLRFVVAELGFERVEVVRGRAEEKDVQAAAGGADIATARAVAPLAKLAGWCLPLVRPGGQLLAIKGSSAREEVDRDAAAIVKAGGIDLEIVHCGDGTLAVPTTVVAMRRAATGRRRRPAR